MTFGERLKQRRLKLNISAGELASLIGKNRATIYRYEKGDIGNVPLDIIDCKREYDRWRNSKTFNGNGRAYLFRFSRMVAVLNQTHLNEPCIYGKNKME